MNTILFFLSKVNRLKSMLLLMVVSLYFSPSSLQAQNCNSGELGWLEVSTIFNSSGCAGCHGVAGGFNLSTYASYIQGGSKCGSSVTQGNTFIDILTVDNYDGCQTPLNGLSMNKRVDGALDSLDLLLIQRWINAGVPEFCEDFCIEDETINITLNNTAYHFQVDSMLTANKPIINSNIIYEAGKSIDLNIGFSVDIVSDFYAFIGACD